MKKLIALLLAMVMMMSFVACGGDEGGQGGDAPAANDIETKFGIDLDAAGQQNMSDEDSGDISITQTANSMASSRLMELVNLYGSFTLDVEETLKTAMAQVDFLAAIGGKTDWKKFLEENPQRIKK